MPYKLGILLLHVEFDFYPKEIKSINTKRINKLHNGVPHKQRDELTMTICSNMDDSQKHNIEQEKSDMKEYMY